jgi:hypothetical protein
MVFKERKEWNSVATSLGVAVGRNKKRRRQSKMLIMLRCRECYARIVGLFGN